jgi:hypothetical protein
MILPRNPEMTGNISIKNLRPGEGTEAVKTEKGR